MSSIKKEEEQLNQIASNFFSTINQGDIAPKLEVFQAPSNKDAATNLKKTRSQSQKQNQEKVNNIGQDLKDKEEKKEDLKKKPQKIGNNKRKVKQEVEYKEDKLCDIQENDISEEQDDEYQQSSSAKDQNEESCSYDSQQMVKKQISQDGEQIVQVSDKVKTIADYVTDSLAKQSKKGKSNGNSRINSRLPSRRPSTYFREDWSDEFIEESYPNGNQADQYGNQQIAMLSPSKRNQLIREEGQKNKLIEKRYTTSASFQKRPNTMNKKWNDKETDLFYKFLGIFGTDFTTIQQYMQTKTVTQIKNKFNKEEKKNPEKINDSLKNPRRRLSQKLNKIQQLEMLKIHYDSKFDLTQSHLQIKSQESQSQQQQHQLLPQLNSSQDLKMLKDSNDSDDNSNLDQHQYPHSSTKLEEIHHAVSQQQLQPLIQGNQYGFLRNQSQLALTRQNLGLLCAAGDKEIPLIDMAKHRKDSHTSNDSVARLIEENIVSIYNKEVELHNNNLKLLKHTSQTVCHNSHGQQEDSEISANSTTNERELIFNTNNNSNEIKINNNSQRVKNLYC